MLGVPVRFRYGRQIALWSWHLHVTVVGDDGSEGIGVSPGYRATASPSLRRIAVQVGGEDIDRRHLEADPAALAAVDLALCDLLGAKRLGLPSKPVLLEGLLWFGERAGVEREARMLAERGIRAIKLKLSGDHARDREVFLAAARHVPPSAIRVDANRAYTSAHDALRVAEFLTDQGCRWIEEPLRDPRTWPVLTEKTGIKVLGDESLITPDAIRRVFDEGLVQGVNIKLARVGGIVHALALVEQSRRANVEPFVGCSEDLASGMAAVLHVASCTPAVAAEGWGAYRLGLEAADRVVERLHDGRVTSWRQLGDTPIELGAAGRRYVFLEYGSRLRLVSSRFRVAQAVASRMTRVVQSLPRRLGRFDVLSPSLGWEPRPVRGGSRYEKLVSAILLDSGDTRLLLPAARDGGLPQGPKVGRLWLPRGNRPLVLLAYLPFQLVFELWRTRARVLRLHSVSHLGLPGVVAATIARGILRRPVRTVVHVHHVEVTGTCDQPGGRLRRRLDRLVLRRADRVVVPSRATASDLEGYGLVDPDRIRVVPNAVPGSVIARRHEPRGGGTELRLAFIGSLSERKRPLDFLIACRLVGERRPCAGWMVGSGPLAGEVDRARADLPVQRHSALTDLSDVYGWADVVVCTSNVEGFFLVGLEALQHGTPVLGYDILALRELLGSGLREWLAPNGELGLLAERLAGLEHKELVDLRRMALERAQAFDVDEFAARLGSVLSEASHA